MLKLLDDFAVICREAGFPFGTIIELFDEKSIIEWIDRGVNWICIGSDISYILNGGINTLNSTRRIISK